MIVLLAHMEASLRGNEPKEDGHERHGADGAALLQLSWERLAHSYWDWRMG